MTMDHAAARERIADLAIEARGLEGLGGSALPEDRELRAHLAGCTDCRAELEAWSRLQHGLAAALPPGEAGRDAAASIEPIPAPSELRSRILAEARGSRAPAAETIAVPPVVPRRSGMRWGGLAWTGLAAALVLAVAAGGVAWDQARRLEAARAEVAALEAVVAAVDRVQSTPGYRVATLVAPDGTAGGSVAWSSHDLVVITTGLPAPPPGQLYRCWLNDGGKGWAVGRMEFAGDTGYWVGTLDEWASFEIRPGTRMRVSLEPANGDPNVRNGPIVLEALLGA